jgi:DNA-binding NtrC family response regulator
MVDFRILFVDDEAEYLETVIKRMKKRGLDVTGAASGADALALMASHDFDVLILDVRMPRMDGIEVLRRVKQSFPLVEVIMLTGHASMEVAIEGMELGAFDYLMKPVDVDELIYKAQDAHQRRKLHMQKINKRKTQGGDSET